MTIALGREDIDNQNKLAKTDAFQQLIRLLRIYKDKEGVILMVIKVLGILCVGKCLYIMEITMYRQIGMQCYDHEISSLNCVS